MRAQTITRFIGRLAGSAASSDSDHAPYLHHNPGTSSADLNAHSGEAAPDASSLDEALRGLIVGLKLGAAEAAALRHASEWCEEQGFDSIEMIKEVGVEDEFVAALALKRGKQMLLRKRLGEMPAAPTVAASAPLEMTARL